MYAPRPYSGANLTAISMLLPLFSAFASMRRSLIGRGYFEVKSNSEEGRGGGGDVDKLRFIGTVYNRRGRRAGACSRRGEHLKATQCGSSKAPTPTNCMRFSFKTHETRLEMLQNRRGRRLRRPVNERFQLTFAAAPRHRPTDFTIIKPFDKSKFEALA